jgi:hypothetical protein
MRLPICSQVRTIGTFPCHPNPNIKLKETLRSAQGDNLRTYGWKGCDKSRLPVILNEVKNLNQLVFQ